MRNISDSLVAVTSYETMYSFAAADLSYVLGTVRSAKLTLPVVVVRGVDGSTTEAYNDFVKVSRDGF